MSSRSAWQSWAVWEEKVKVSFVAHEVFRPRESCESGRSFSGRFQCESHLFVLVKLFHSLKVSLWHNLRIHAILDSRMIVPLVSDNLFPCTPGAHFPPFLSYPFEKIGTCQKCQRDSDRGRCETARWPVGFEFGERLARLQPSWFFSLLSCPGLAAAFSAASLPPITLKRRRKRNMVRSG